MSLARFTVGLGLLGLVACGGGSGSGGGGVVGPPSGNPGTLSVSITSRLGISVFEEGGNRLEINRALMLISAIQLEPSTVLGCGNTDECIQLAGLPVVAEIPLDGSSITILSDEVATGNYDGLTVSIEPLTAALPGSQSLLEDFPELEGSSVLVDAVFNGTPVTFTTSFAANDRDDMFPQLRVEESGTSFRIDVFVGEWFRNVSEILIDPATAAPGQPNRNAVEGNIAESFIPVTE